MVGQSCEDGRRHQELHVAERFQSSPGRGKHRLAVNGGQTLRCEECGMESETGEAWLAFVTVEKEVVVYCPDCAEREFGDDPPNDATD